MSEKEEENDPMSESESESDEINLEHMESEFASSVTKFGIPVILLYGASPEKVFVTYEINPHGVETPLFLLAADHLLNSTRSLDAKWILYFSIFAGDADYHMKGTGGANGVQNWDGFNAAIDKFPGEGLGFAFLLFQDPLLSKLHVRYWNAESKHHHFYAFMECLLNRSDEFRTHGNGFAVLMDMATSVEQKDDDEDDDDMEFGGGNSDVSCTGAIEEVNKQWALLLAQV